MPKPLTELERRVLDYLVEFLRRNTYQPSIREIGREFSIKSTKTVSELLQSLADKGWVERDPSRSRGVRLLGTHLGDATATVPLYRSRDPQRATVDLFEIDRKLAGSAGTYLLAIDSDVADADIGLRPGDLLLVEPADAAHVSAGDVLLLRGAHGLEIARHPVPSLRGLEGRVLSVVRRVAPAHGGGRPVSAAVRPVARSTD